MYITDEEMAEMSEAQIARYEKGRWIVPVGSVLDTQHIDCQDCGTPVTVLMVRTADGDVLIADDLNDHVDDGDGDFIVLCAVCTVRMMNA